MNLESINLDDVFLQPDRVNSGITCPHGKLTVDGSSDQIARVVSHRTLNLVKDFSERF